MFCLCCLRQSPTVDQAFFNPTSAALPQPLEYRPSMSMSLCSHLFGPCKQTSGTTPSPKLHHLSRQLTYAWWNLVLLLLLLWFVVLTCSSCRLAFLPFKTQLSEFYSGWSWNHPTTLNLLLALWRNFSKVKSVERSGIYLQQVCSEWTKMLFHRLGSEVRGGFLKSFKY